MSWRSRTGSRPTPRRRFRAAATFLCLAVLGCVAIAACIRNVPATAPTAPPPAGYEDKIAELDALGLLRERQRLVEEITFLEERIGELRAVQMVQEQDSPRDALRQDRMEGLEQWRDVAMRKKAHVDEVLDSGAFTRHSVRYKVNAQVLGAGGEDTSPAATLDATPADKATAPARWENLPAVEPGGKAVVHRLSHETRGDTLRVRIEYSGRASAKLRNENDPQAFVIDIAPVAQPGKPEGSIVIGPDPAAAPAGAAPARDMVSPAPGPAPAPAPSGPPGVLGVKHGPRGKGFEARVRLSGQAPKYRWFTMDDPPRIVVDVYGVRPPSPATRTIPVGGEQVLRIRTGWHRGPSPASSKYRMVLDTSPSYLRAFKVVSDESGVAVLLP